MKARFLLISLLTFLVFSLSSCFLKKLFKHNEHQIEHRGDYKKMGKHAQYYPSKAERVRGHKHHRHGRHYRHKVEKRRRRAAAKKAQAAQDNGNNGSFQTDWKDSTGQSHPVVPGQQNTSSLPTSADTTKVRTEPPPVQAMPQEQTTPAPQPAPQAEQPQKKHKHKKGKKQQADQGVQTDQSQKSDTTGSK